MAKDERVTRLEENLYFLEEKVGALDEQITAIQRDMDIMTASVQRLTQAVAEVRAILDGSQKTVNRIDEVPPHHEPRLW